MVSIKLDREVSDAFIGDVMTTIVESGYDCLFSWAVVETIERDNDSVPVVIAFALDEDVMDAQEALADDGTELDVTVHTVTSDMIAPAIQKIIDNKLIGTVLMPYLVRAVLDEDAGDIDATLADCIVQVAALGEVRYG